MSSSIWTRLRKLQDHEAGLLHNLRMNKKSLDVELDIDDWVSAQISANAILADCIRMQEVERELEDVVELVEGYARIEARMERLENES